MVTKYFVDPDKEFANAVKKTLAEVSDLTIPFKLITKSWYQSNKFIFNVKSGPGKYEDLSEAYKRKKQALVGFVYPVLKLYGKLEKSLTNPGDANTIALILNRQTLILGTKVPYAGYLQGGTSRMPARPPVLIGAESTAPPELNQRRQLWIQTLENYVLEKAKQVGTPK